jgi:type II secretion system protein G
MCLSALNDAEIEIVGKRVPYVRDGKEILFYSADGFNRSNVCVGMPETPEQYIQLARIRYRINKSKIPMPIGAPGAFDATMMMTEKGWQLVEPFYFAWQLAVVPEPFNYNDELLKRSEVTWVETKTRMPARVMYRRDYDDLRKGIEAAMYSFELDTGNFPTTDAGFGALIAKPKNKIQGWRGPYIRELLSDQWGNPFFLKGDGTSYAVFSVGPDGIKDTMDDIPIASGRKNN